MFFHGGVCGCSSGLQCILTLFQYRQAMEAGRLPGCSGTVSCPPSQVLPGAEIGTDLTLKSWEMESLVVSHPQQNADVNPREVLIIITATVTANILAFCGLSYST